MTDLEIKAAVRKRDGNRCVECGMANDEHLQLFGSSLEVHRITPGSPYTLEGTATLCKRCHGPKPRSPRGKRDAILLTGSLVRQIKKLAEREQRPVLWQARILLQQALEAEGLWPPEDRL